MQHKIKHNHKKAQTQQKTEP